MNKFKNFADVIENSDAFWHEFPNEENSYKNFESIMREHFITYSGEGSDDELWNSWHEPIKLTFNQGAHIERVVFLSDISELKIDAFDNESSWTIHDVCESGLIDYLHESAVEIGKAENDNKAFLFKAYCPANNIHLANVPIPNEHSELEINIVNNDKLSIVKVYEIENDNQKLIGALNLKTKQLTLKNKLCNEKLIDYENSP